MIFREQNQDGTCDVVRNDLSGKLSRVSGHLNRVWVCICIVVCAVVHPA